MIVLPLEGRGAAGHPLDSALRGFTTAPLEDLGLRAPTSAAFSAVAAAVGEASSPRREAARRLREHNRHLGNEAGDLLCDALEDPASLVVMTGQQPGLFGGPLMVAAKIAGAVTLARRLADELGRPVVPVFWNHSEDHDLDEVNRFEELEGVDVRRHRAPMEDRGLCLESLRIDESAVGFVDERLDAAGLRVLPEALRARSGEAYSEWVSRCLLTLLPDLPILHAEPRVLRSLLEDFQRRAFAGASDLSRHIAEATERVRAEGFDPQVVSEDPSPFFLIEEDGRRRRLLSRGGWHFSGEESDAESERALVERITSDPTRLSATALIRPLAVQHLLPVIAHVNGPAENAYFAQSLPLFDAFERPRPLAFPRPTVTLLTPRIREIADALGLDPVALMEDPESWPQAEHTVGDPGIFSRAREDLERLIGGIELSAEDDGLERAVASYRKKQFAALETLEKTFTRHWDRSAGVGRDRRERLARWTWPRGKPQERLLSPITLLRGADPTRLGAWLGTLDPFDFRHRLLLLESADLGGHEASETPS